MKNVSEHNQESGTIDQANPKHLRVSHDSLFKLTNATLPTDRRKPDIPQDYKHIKQPSVADPQTFSLFVKRPLMTWAICMAACIVMGLIILIPSLADTFGLYTFGQVQQNRPFSESAILLLAYCAPAAVAIATVILKNLYIHRAIRIALAGISYACIIIVFWLAVDVCFLPLSYVAYQYVLQILQTINSTWWWAIMILGFLFGLSLPVSERARIHVRKHPGSKKTRHIVRIFATLWFIVLGVLNVILLMPYFL